MLYFKNNNVDRVCLIRVSREEEENGTCFREDFNVSVLEVMPVQSQSGSRKGKKKDDRCERKWWGCIVYKQDLCGSIVKTLQEGNSLWLKGRSFSRLRRCYRVHFYSSAPLPFLNYLYPSLSGLTSVISFTHRKSSPTHDAAVCTGLSVFPGITWPDHSLLSHLQRAFLLYPSPYPWPHITLLSHFTVFTVFFLWKKWLMSHCFWTNAPCFCWQDPSSVPGTAVLSLFPHLDPIPSASTQSSPSVHIISSVSWKLASASYVMKCVAEVWSLPVLSLNNAVCLLQLLAKLLEDRNLFHVCFLFLTNLS